MPGPWDVVTRLTNVFDNACTFVVIGPRKGVGSPGDLLVTLSIPGTAGFLQHRGMLETSNMAAVMRVSVLLALETHF